MPRNSAAVASASIRPTSMSASSPIPMKKIWMEWSVSRASSVPIMEELGLENTLLGVDVVLNKRLVAGDVNERDLLGLTGGRQARIVVTVIGGQGYILGRGNQQLSPQVIRQVGKDNIIVVASMEKLASLGGRPLLVDTGDAEFDQALSGYTKVTVDFNSYAMHRVGI